GTERGSRTRSKARASLAGNFSGIPLGAARSVANLDLSLPASVGSWISVHTFAHWPHREHSEILRESGARKSRCPGQGSGHRRTGQFGRVVERYSRRTARNH